jgi:aminodeoxyfutalosine deaminase
VIDISRERTAGEGLIVAGWVANARNDGVVALGLGGPEAAYPPEKFTSAFERARAAGVAGVPHAGETDGPKSMWGALRFLHADRIGHGVRCLEDADLVQELRERQTPLEVCPISNVCLGVASSMATHPLPRLLDAGLYVTINSDDPAMFNTSLIAEYREIAAVFGLGYGELERLVLNGVHAALLQAEVKERMAAEFRAEFARLRRANGQGFLQCHSHPGPGITQKGLPRNPQR